MASESEYGYKPAIFALVRRYVFDTNEGVADYYARSAMHIAFPLSEFHREKFLGVLFMAGCAGTAQDELQRHIRVVIAFKPYCDWYFGSSWFKSAATKAMLETPGELFRFYLDHYIYIVNMLTM